MEEIKVKLSQGGGAAVQAAVDKITHRIKESKDNNSNEEELQALWDGAKSERALAAQACAGALAHLATSGALDPAATLAWLQAVDQPWLEAQLLWCQGVHADVCWHLVSIARASGTR